MLRSLALVALVALTASACDSGGDEVQPLGGILFVSLEGAASLRLESSLELPCGPRIAADTQTLGGRVQVTVRGATAAGSCAELAPATVTIPLQTGGASPVPIDLIFGGVVDEYRYTRSGSEARLDSVRYSVSCLGRRPAQPVPNPVCRLLK